MRTTAQESLGLIGSDLGSRPGVGPGGFWRARILGNGRFRGFLGGIGVFAPEDASKKRHCEVGGHRKRVDKQSKRGDNIKDQEGYQSRKVVKIKLEQK